jgi:transcriptional regulator with XRE-family HTH domain
MAMDDLRVGALARAIRHRLGLTQRQIAVRAHVSQSLVSLFERGHLADLSLRSIRQIGNALEIQLPFAPRWRGGDGIRLIDAHHAELLDRVVGVLRDVAWEVVVEYTFNHYGERGSVDIVAWHEASRTLLLIEVKSRLLDSQEMNATLDRKRRIVPELLARERGWHPAQVGVVVAVAGLTANRSVVQRHADTFAATYPERARAIRSWIRRPVGDLRGLWFLSDTNPVGTNHVALGRKRIRPRHSRSERPVERS